ncbi:MAG: redox-sensing transcriptional repressor Rex [Bacillales bacterium]
MTDKILNKNQLKRLPTYLKLLQELKTENIDFINAQEIADRLFLNKELVKKDIAAIASQQGIPNKGREIGQLIIDLENYLGVDDIHSAVLIGCGRLGLSLLDFNGFKKMNLKIVGLFDNDLNKIGTRINDLRINDISRLEYVRHYYHAQIAIIATPNNAAQEVANIIEKSNFEAIWNLTSVNINIKNKNIIVLNTNLAKSMALISSKLEEKRKRG